MTLVNYKNKTIRFEHCIDKSVNKIVIKDDKSSVKLSGKTFMLMIELITKICDNEKKHGNRIIDFHNLPYMHIGTDEKIIK
jgi:hypothetical protein